jgi:hypothetical protein
MQGKASLGIAGFLYTKERNASETDPVPEILCSLDYRAMDEDQDPSNPECYMLPSSKTLEGKTYPVNATEITEKRIITHTLYV